MVTHNPYWGNDFFQFFYTLFCRLYQFVVQGREHMELASDELQLLVLVLISAQAALLGTFFVLRKATMLVNALSHTILPGIVLAFFAYHYFAAPSSGYDFSQLLPSDSLLMLGALSAAFVTTFLYRLIVAVLPVAEDASIGMVFTLLLSLGIILVTALSRSAHVGAELLMGNVDALHPDDLSLALWVCVATFAFCIFFWRPLFVTSFDPLFAKMCQISNDKISYLLMALVSVCAVGAFRAVGVLLFIAFLVTPPLLARRFTHSLSQMAILSCLSGVTASIVGVALSRHILSFYELSCSTSGLIVTLLALIYLLTLALIRRSQA